MTLERKLELAMWLCEHNYNISLTGSMMLYIRWIQQNGNTLDNFYLGREPQDLDFIVNVEEEYEDGDFSSSVQTEAVAKLHQKINELISLLVSMELDYFYLYFYLKNLLFKKLNIKIV